MSTQNMNYQRYLNQMNLPLCSKQKKKLYLHMKKLVILSQCSAICHFLCPLNIYPPGETYLNPVFLYCLPLLC